MLLGYFRYLICSIYFAWNFYGSVNGWHWATNIAKVECIRPCKSKIIMKLFISNYEPNFFHTKKHTWHRKILIPLLQSFSNLWKKDGQQPDNPFQITLTRKGFLVQGDKLWQFLQLEHSIEFFNTINFCIPSKYCANSNALQAKIQTIKKFPYLNIQ